MRPSVPTSPVTLSSAQVVSARHLPSLLAMTLSAGAVNAGAFEVSERYVTHVTGAVTRLGVDTEVMVESLLVLGAFVLGAMLSVPALAGRVAKGLPPRPAWPMFGAAFIVLAASVLGLLGVFGPATGGRETTTVEFVMVLALAMGLLNASVASSTALAVRTTHMTGPSTDFGVALATAFYQQGDARRQSLSVAALRGSTLVAFVVGAAAMFPVVAAFGYAAFLAPAVVLMLATLRSFTSHSP